MSPAIVALGNYIGSENKFMLAEPPDWWLKALFDYDSQLVVFPSRHRMVYVLARRRHFSNAMAELDKLDKDLVRQSAGLDGDIMAAHNLIFVRHLIGDTVRRHNIFQWLRDHDLKAQGGGEVVSQAIEDIETARAAKVRKSVLDNIDHRARDAWRSYQARTGRRSSMAGPRRRAQQMPVPSFDAKHSSPVAMFVADR